MWATTCRYRGRRSCVTRIQQWCGRESSSKAPITGSFNSNWPPLPIIYHYPNSICKWLFTSRLTSLINIRLISISLQFNSSWTSWVRLTTFGHVPLSILEITKRNSSWTDWNYRPSSWWCWRRRSWPTRPHRSRNRHKCWCNPSNLKPSFAVWTW